MRSSQHSSARPGGEVDFQLTGSPALSRSTVDRRELVRGDPGLLRALWENGRMLAVDPLGRALVTREEAAPHRRRLVDRPVTDAEPPEEAVLLGADGETGYWAVPVSEGEADAWAERVPESEREWLDLRFTGALLDDTGAGLLTTAVGLLSWHRRAAFCANCGAPSVASQAGWTRHCTGCGREEYPRTDPAVICLVHDGAGNVVLARQPTWPADRYSILAGFVETGESLEHCVVREVAEEVGVQVGEVRYLGSQPWPFPRSLMMGFTALAEPSAPLHPADGEIEQAHWVPRDRVRTALRAGGGVPGLILPGASSIARGMLEAWAWAG
ncbi:NAD(+) diphosphatase [Actinoalloteichus caeruleus]|uniref:NAD(+) diphosphatase n=1 Tax=Actinoalloteichus cyanogriseus TaxID=2893586 RepID=UPI000AE8D292|nr:NAD(+) diphosphatase [Actinoalloteichus caeruleus]